jgi:NAD(P)-dependent dehydrogenase (short-subunit alcohol dehydrogenase family)
MPTEAQAVYFKSHGDKLPVGHASRPEEVAEAYLCSMKCTYMTGQTMLVDGGSTLI